MKSIEPGSPARASLEERLSPQSTPQFQRNGNKLRRKAVQMLNALSIGSEGKRGLLSLLLVSLILKTSIAFCTLIVNPDGALYISVAQKFAAGEFREAPALFPMPFYPLLIAFFHLFIPHWVGAARFISVASSVLVLIPLYLLTRRLFNERAAFWSCAAWTLSPVVNGWAVDIIRDLPFLFFFAWNVYFALRAIESKRLFHFIMTVFLSALSVLLRIEGIVFVPFFLLFLVFLALKEPEARGAFLKGTGIWLGILLGGGLLLFLILGPSWNSFNRLDQVVHVLKGFFQFQFLENYRLIAEQLKVFQASLPNPDGGQSFLEIARHYMPLIYFIGFLESLVKFLFLPFTLPLLLGLKHSGGRDRLFVLLLTLLFLLVVYYRLIEMNFITERYLLTPVFLLYPWIGRGMESLLSLLDQTSHKRFFIPVVLVLFVIVPVYKSINPLRHQDVVAKTAGEWIAREPRFQGATLMSTDGRVPFYAGRGRDYLKYEDADYLELRRAALSATDADPRAISRTAYYSAMEPRAFSQRIDLIVIRIPAKRKDSLPQFIHYQALKEFQGKKDWIVLYVRNDLVTE